jgi:hypothetical protein
MNLKFVLRGVLVGVPATLLFALIGLSIIISRTPAGSPPEPTPPAPVITAPRGEMPSGPVGLAELAQYRDKPYLAVGSGFVLRLGNGDLVGVTTAHSLDLDNPRHPLDRVALRIPEQTAYVAECDTLHGLPGRPVDGPDLSIDYVLLRLDKAVDDSLALVPDPRGGPQPGERVSLYSGREGGAAGLSELSGTVQSVSEEAAWVLMDRESFRAGGMSGAPFVSQHTGQVVGMAIAASPRHLRLIPLRYRQVLGMHPIGSIVEKAEAADSYPMLSTYQR